MRYDVVVRYADKDADTFPNFRLPTNPIQSNPPPPPPPEEQAVHQNETRL